jgi:predicted DNA-binding WGR domain protein
VCIMQYIHEVSAERAPMICHLEHHRPDKNCFRYYRMEVTPDLFGTWTLRRSWGRIGTKGRDCLVSYLDEDQASVARLRLVRAKQRKGYVLLTEQMNLPFDLFEAP